jgi:PAS domain S-box-containing protein
MDERVTIAASELEALRERVSRLSREKAHLAMVNELINRIGSAAGLDDLVTRLLTTLMNTIGGSNLKLYYKVDDDLFLADVYGRRERIPRIDDPQVAAVFETGEFACVGEAGGASGPLTGGNRAGAVWVFPLRAGEERIGACRMEGILIDGPAIRSQLQSVFRYAAMALRGEIQNYSRLKSAYDALRHSEERFRSVVGTAHDGILLLDEAGRIVFWNAAAEAIFGFTAAEATGHPLSLVVPGESRERHGERLARMKESAGSISAGRVMQVDGRRNDGSPVPLELSLAAWSAGNETFCTVVARDLRQRREAEEALRASEEQLRQAMKMEAVGRLAGGIAHDFNNLLTVINGYSEMLLRRMEPGADHYRELEEVRRAGTRAASLTQQLLAFSRRQVVEKQPLDLNQVVRGMADMLHRLIGEDILLEVALSDSPLVVMADQGQVEQVVANLAVNARDAMPDGGALNIRTAAITPDPSFFLRHSGVMPVPYAVLSVADTGSGMDDRTKEHLFEPFFTTKPIGKGTGLGLSTVYGIVTQGGGHIEVDSEPGRGTVFNLYLPIVPSGVPVDSGGACLDAPGGDETILLVEDEAMVRSMIREILQDLGYAVIEAGNGVEALAHFERSPADVDLLVTDVVMPRMNGRELAGRVRAISPRTRLLFISGYTDHDSVQSADFPPDAAFLQKPFMPDAFARKVREALDACPPPG